MDFELTDEQVALAEGVAKLCAGRFPVDRLRAVADEGTGFDRQLWRDLAEAGVFSLRLGEDAGGVGLGMAEAGLVFAELGRALVPGPLVWTHLAAGLVPGAAEGERVVAGLVAGDFASTRSPLLLEHLDASDVVVVLHGDAVVAADAAAVRATARAVELPTDPLTPVAVLDEPPAGERVGDAGVAARWRTEGTVLSAAMAAGIARATTDLAVAYATERYQFDRPIGSFQAIKHILADMLVRSEVARAAADAAAVLLDDPEAGDAERAVAAAKVVAGDAAVRNAEACIQVHGGMGFTWEAQPHFFLKRAWVLDADFGSADVHAEAIAAARPSR